MMPLCMSVNRLRLFAILILGESVCGFASAEPRLYWPTANPAFLNSEEPTAFLQPTESGRIQSGDWGCTRNKGSRFHEGVDLKSLTWLEDGKAGDFVFAAATGVIAHVNTDIADSNYGKYIVIAHRETHLEWFTLYAHLDGIRANIRPGQVVKAGEAIGRIGNTSATIDIPRERSHLHFELGLRMNSYFDFWYREQNYETPNPHGSWNGLNLAGTNPFEFYQHTLEHNDLPFASYFLEQPVSFSLLLYFEQPPDFLVRNPVFLKGAERRIHDGWYTIGFTWYGLPVRWEYLSEKQVDMRLEKGAIHIRSFKHERPCRNWLDEKEGVLQPTTLLQNLVSLLKTHG
jgi:murein DD-endopeptidase MepM/ murein hydrolase activator NlpD